MGVESEGATGDTAPPVSAGAEWNNRRFMSCCPLACGPEQGPARPINFCLICLSTSEATALPDCLKVTRLATGAPSLAL